MPTRALVVLITVLAPLAAQAQRASTAAVPVPALQAAGDFLHAVERADWRAAGALLDSASVAQGWRITLASEPDSIPRPTVEEIRRERPDMPEAVAEYLVKVTGEHSPDEFISLEYADVKDLAALRAMPLAEVAARWVQANDQRYQSRRAFAETQKRCPAGTTVADSVWAKDAPHFVILGGFPARARRRGEAPSAWVAFADTAGFRAPPDSMSGDWSRPNLLHVRSTAAGWRVVPAPQLFGNTMFGFSGCISPHEEQRKP